MKGIITWFVDNIVVANLLMILIFVGGFFTLSKIKMEIFPSFAVDVVTISVLYPGASPENIEKNICIPIEESIQGISGLKKITSSSSSGYGIVAVEIMAGEDVDFIKDEIENSVDRIKTFPEDIEKPIINQILRNNQVLFVTLSGNMDDKSLDILTKKVKDEIDLIDGIDLTEIAIDRSASINIELDESKIVQHGISTSDIKNVIFKNMIELPGGKIENDFSQKTIRIEQTSYSKEEIGNISLYSLNGDKIKLNQVADIRSGYDGDDIRPFFNGEPCSYIAVYRVGNQNAIEVSDKINSYIDKKKNSLPEGIKISSWSDESEYLRGRIDLLVKNAWIGLVLVMFVLSLFLKPKLSFWVSLGIPISFLGALWFFPFLDVSINMLSLFTFILVLGIVVDDAIVVGENFYQYKQKGYSSRDSAIKGAYEVSKPVIFAVLTTMVTFSPMLFIPGASGSVWKIFPLVVIPILFFSLFESLTILPAHLAHSKESKSRFIIFNKISEKWDSVRFKVDEILQIVIDDYYSPFLYICLKRNISTISVFISIIILVIGLIYSGIIKFNFFPGLEADNVRVQIEYPKGTPLEQTEDGVNQISNTLKDLEIKYDGKIDSSSGVILNKQIIIGAQPEKAASSGRGSSTESSYSGSNLAEILIELSPGENRDILAEDIAKEWRTMIGDIPGIKDLTVSTDLFSPGEDIYFQFTSIDNEKLKNMVRDFKKVLEAYPGVYNITDNADKGSIEIFLRLKPQAESQGVQILAVSEAVRDSFQGTSVAKIRDGREEVDVILGLPDSDKTSLESLKDLKVKVMPDKFAKLKDIAIIELKEGFSNINRVNRNRALSVIANVDNKISNANEIIASIEKNDMPILLEKYKDVKYSLEGQQREQSENLDSLKNNYILALFVIFILLAIPFKSYAQPFIIMSAIPFGIVGAVFGHLILGMDFSILSMLGIAALSGIVVNDSLVMMDYINRINNDTNDPIKAAMKAGPIRFRPILLTSLTTFIGVMPLIFEKSLQAKFLVPMAVSLGFGVLFATFVILILVPCSYMFVEKVKFLIKKI